MIPRRQAEFEAWLTGGVYIQEDEGYRVLSPEKAKQEIRDLIRKDDYDKAKRLAESLKNTLSFSQDKISKSIRVSFPVYVKLTEFALKTRSTVNAWVNRLVIGDVERQLEEISTRKDVSSEKTRELGSSLDSWKKSLAPDGTEGTVFSGPRRPRNPSVYTVPNFSREMARLCSERWLEEVRKKCSKIPVEAFEKYLEKTDVEKMPEELENEPSLFLPIRLEIAEDMKLRILLCVRYVLMPSNMSDEEIYAFEEEMREEFGSDTVSKFTEVDEGFFTPDGASFEAEVYSGDLEDKNGQLLLDGIIIPAEEEAFNEMKLKFLSKYNETQDNLKKELEEALRNGLFDKVAKLSDLLSVQQRRKKLEEFSLGIIFHLLGGKTQVISFKAPELIVRAWEAYGDTELSQILDWEVPPSER